MKLAGFLLLPAGWGIVVSAVVLFSQAGLLWSFVLSGLCVEAGGLALALYSSRPVKEATE
jgi:hypothetical protein